MSPQKFACQLWVGVTKIENFGKEFIFQELFLLAYRDHYYA